MRFSIAVAVALMIASSAVRAQEVGGGAGSDSACVNFNSSRKGLYLRLEGRNTVSGMLPFKYCGLGIGGEYPLTLEGEGFERRRGKLILGRGTGASLSGYVPGTVLLNCVLPGAGSYKRGRTIRGSLDLLSVTAGLVKLYDENSKYDDLEERLDRITGLMTNASTIMEMEQLREEAHRSSIALNIQNSYRKRLFAVTSFLYAYQVLEPLFFDTAPKAEIGSNGKTVSFNAIRLNRGKAFVYSVIRPGRGQLYQGKKVRGTFFSAAVAVSGLLTLELFNQYDVKVGDYDIAVERFNSASTIQERQELGYLVDRIWDEVEERKKARDISIYVTAGLWCWSIIDTLFPADGALSDSDYSCRVTPHGLEIAFKF